MMVEPRTPIGARATLDADGFPRLKIVWFTLFTGVHFLLNGLIEVFAEHVTVLSSCRALNEKK